MDPLGKTKSSLFAHFVIAAFCYRANSEPSKAQMFVIKTLVRECLKYIEDNITVPKLTKRKLLLDYTRHRFNDKQDNKHNGASNPTLVKYPLNCNFNENSLLSRSAFSFLLSSEALSRFVPCPHHIQYPHNGSMSGVSPMPPNN